MGPAGQQTVHELCSCAKDGAVLGSIGNNIASRSGKVILALLSPTEATSGVGAVCTSSVMKDMK